jgi:hypothetical protein
MKQRLDTTTDPNEDRGILYKIQNTASNSVQLIGMTLAAVAILTYVFILILREASRDASLRPEKFVVGRDDEPNVPALRADVTPPPIDLHGSMLNGPNQGAFISKLARTTKGDGALRDVRIDGQLAPREIVQQAMFDNADFAPRTDQFPLFARGQATDTTTQKQRDFFAPR